DLRVGSFTAAVADQYEHDLLARASACRELRECSLDVRFRRLSLVVRRLRHTVFTEPRHFGVGNSIPCNRDIRERARKPREGIGILLLAAQTTHDDEMRLRAHAMRRCTERDQAAECSVRDESPDHARPLALRYDHSAVTSATSRI